MNRPALVALGDSLSCGEGVGVRVPQERTWVALLAGALDARLVPLARPGATVHDVAGRQVAAAPPGEVATVLVGLNDITRAGWSPEAFADALFRVVTRLRAGSVLLGRVHDPTRLLPLPRRVRAGIATRVAQVNAAVDACARADTRVRIVDVGAVPDLALRRSWAADRLHPELAGHWALAAAAAGVAAAAGHRVAGLPPAPAPVPPPTLAAEARWLAAHGLPWLARHGGRTALVPRPRRRVIHAG